MNKENIEYLKESCKNQFGFEQDKIITYNEAQEIVKHLEDLQQENKQLKKENEKLSLIMHKALNWFVCLDRKKLQDLLDILKGDSNE